MVGGPPYSPGATPVDHFIGFLCGSMIFVRCLIGFFADDGGGGGDADIGESWDIGAVAEMQHRIAIFGGFLSLM